jgi:hypothetical protein
MKGAMPIGTMLILALFFIALIIAVIFANINYAKGMELPNVGTAAQQILGEQADVTYISEAVPSEESETPDHIYSSLDSDDPFRPSEIACYISEAIFTDFTAYGIESSRQDCFPESPYQFCSIDSRRFKLQQGASDELSWESNLTAVDCKLCKEGSVVVPELDEVCINYNLVRTFNSGGIDYDFCDGPIDPVQGSLASFSNSDCGNVNDPAPAEHGNDDVSGWNNHCDGWLCVWPNFDCFWTSYEWFYAEDDGNDFCDNQRDSTEDNEVNMIVWHAEIVGSDTDQYFVSDQIVDELERAGGEEYTFNFLNKTPHEYVYSIFWIPEKKRYNLYFERVPASNAEGDEESNFDFLINDDMVFRSNYDSAFGEGVDTPLNDDDEFEEEYYISAGDSKKRFSPVGYDDPGARRVMDRIVILPEGNDISVIDLMEQMKDQINDNIDVNPSTTTEWDVEGTVGSTCEREGGDEGKRPTRCIYLDATCSGEECINGNSELVSDRWNGYLSQIENEDDEYDWTLYALNDYNIKFSVDETIAADSGILRAGQKYRVVVNNWVHVVNDYNAIMIDKSVGIYPIEEEEEDE